MRVGIAVLALTFVASAAAKGPDHASICGAAHCVALQGEVKVYSLLDWRATPVMLVDAPKPAPYYAITLRDWGSILYVPKLQLIRIRDTSSPPYWRSIPRYEHATYARYVRGLSPRPAPARWPPR